MTSLIDSDSLLAVDVGAVWTRASLFDVVEGRYRFVAQGISPSTAVAPYRNIGEGVRLAIDQLQKTTGRVLVGADEQLIIPTAADGSGVDSFAATMSAGDPLKVVVVGLLEDVSLESARRLANTTYSRVVQTFSLNDRKRTDSRLNLLVRARPDLVVMAGGTDQGASQSVMKLLEAVGLACYLMPKENRPDVLFVGNQALKEEISSSLSGMTTVHFAPNVRPALETEDLSVAQAELARIFALIRSRQIGGVADLNHWANGGLTSSAAALGRVVRFLSKAHTTKKGVLGVDLGASATTMASAFNGELNLGIYPQFGSSGLADLGEATPMKEIARWLTTELSESQVREYITNKFFAPGSVPVTVEEQALEGAVTRYLLQSALRLAARSFPAQANIYGEGILPWFEPILATGGVFAHAPSLAQCALTLLDGLQPSGVTTLVVDQNQIATALGAAAPLNPMLVVQTLDSNCFLHLATVITVMGKAKQGSPVLRMKVTHENNQETNLEIAQGALEVVALRYGQSARLQLQPLQRADVGLGAAGRGGSLKVIGGALGVIIDARGRPLALPADLSRRQELYKKWLWTLGGQ
jgi:hypothetical protein